jgi:hypothetical protein
MRRMDTSHLTDAQRQKLRPPLPPRKPRTGRPAKDHRAVRGGRVGALRTGTPRALRHRCLLTLSP